MTLVVGCATPDIGYLVADTLVSFSIPLIGRNETLKNETHCLKVQILNGETAVAFAGDHGVVETSHDLIASVYAELRSNPQLDPSEKLFELYSQLTAAHRAPDCEFLVLQLAEKGKDACSHHT